MLYGIKTYMVHNLCYTIKFCSIKFNAIRSYMMHHIEPNRHIEPRLHMININNMDVMSSKFLLSLDPLSA